MLNLVVIKTILILFVSTPRDCKAQNEIEVGLDTVDLETVNARPSQGAIDNSTFIFYFGKTSSETLNVSLNQLEQITKHPKFEANKPVTLFFHGFRNKQNTSAVRKIVKAYTTFCGHNLIVLDWADAAAGSYFEAFSNVEPLAKKIAAILLDAFRKNILKIESVFVVGHSLGAQLGGIIGQHFKKQSFGTKLRRISGLDPAGPLFFPDLPILVPDNHLSEDDARFVDIVHTDCGGYGYPVQTGSADFYVNSGYRFQPGCGTENPSGGSCSHNRAVDFWVESVVNNKSFYAVGVEKSSGWTNGWDDFKHHEIDKNNIVLMGISCPETADGRYYLQTNKASPFGRGMGGIYYDDSLEKQ